LAQRSSHRKSPADRRARVAARRTRKRVRNGKGGDAIPDRDAINPYWLERRWNALKHRFDDLRSREDLYVHHVLVMEEQAAFVAAHHADLAGADIGQAYMLAGLHVAMAIDPDLTYRFEGFGESVWALARRCLATCHPDFNPEVAAAAERMWRSDEDRKVHFMACGAVLRRLVDSTQFWARRGSRAYVQHVTDWLRQTGWDPQVDKIHFIVGGNQLPE